MVGFRVSRVYDGLGLVMCAEGLGLAVCGGGLWLAVCGTVIFCVSRVC